MVERGEIERVLYFGMGVQGLPFRKAVNNRKECTLEQDREIQMSVITLWLNVF